MSADRYSRWTDLTPYSPPAHHGTTNHRLLTGEQTDRRLSMVHGRLEPGGAAERHLHRHSAQVTHILAGRCTVDLDGSRDAMGPGDTVFIAPGVMHEVIVDGDQALELINVYQPPLQPDDICTGEDDAGRADGGRADGDGGRGVGGDGDRADLGRKSGHSDRTSADGVAADLGRKSGGDGPADGVAPRV